MAKNVEIGVKYHKQTSFIYLFCALNVSFTFRVSMSISESKACILNCPLCLKTYEDPRILPCQHSACEKCLSSYIKTIVHKETDQHNGLPCPVCKKKTKLKDASMFPKSLTIAALLDSKKLKTKIQKAYAKTNINTRTLGTQTSFNDAYIESDSVLGKYVIQHSS